MEYLDTYDQNGNFLGKQPRDIVHREALWHNTVHCWLYDKWGNIFFQKRTEEGTLYTTASGHVLAGETVKEAFGREIEEEIGISIDYEKAILVRIVPYILDKVKKDGTIFRDRAFANVYVFQYDENNYNFKFDPNELKGLVKVNAEETLHLFKQGTGSIKGEVITDNQTETKKIMIQDFLVNQGETLIEKYGEVLEKIIEQTKSLSQ